MATLLLEALEKYVIEDVANMIYGYWLPFEPEFLDNYGAAIKYPVCDECGSYQGCMYCGKRDKYMSAYEAGDHDEVFLCCPQDRDCWQFFLTQPPSCRYCDKPGSGCRC